MTVKTNLQRFAFVGLAIAGSCVGIAKATPLLVIDARSGEVLVEQQATQPWYPASLTKLVTTYAALKAVKQGRLKLDTPMVVSNRAFRAPPSKMAFRPGQEITLDNALKILMVKSANDVAITIAEGVSGSVESFATEMNRVAAELGMRESHFVNPNGLHDPGHVSSARDMATIGRALYRDFPEHADLFGIGALRLGNRIIPTHNGIMGRYPGADGMKTGFVCASGFNVVASATRGGRRLIAVVMGYPNAKSRTLKAASLFDEGFLAAGSGRQLAALPATGGGAPDIRADICGRNRQNIQEDDFAVPIAGYAQPATSMGESESPAAFFANDGRAAAGSPTRAASITAEQMAVRPQFEPVPVFVGRAPGSEAPVVAARGARPTIDASRAKPIAAKPIAATAFAARPGTRDNPIATDPDAKPLKLAGPKPKTPEKAQKTASRAKPEGKTKAIAQAKPGKDKKKKTTN